MPLGEARVANSGHRAPPVVVPHVGPCLTQCVIGRRHLPFNASSFRWSLCSIVRCRSRLACAQELGWWSFMARWFLSGRSCRVGFLMGGGGRHLPPLSAPSHGILGSGEVPKLGLPWGELGALLLVGGVDFGSTPDRSNDCRGWCISIPPSPRAVSHYCFAGVLVVGLDRFHFRKRPIELTDSLLSKLLARMISTDVVHLRGGVSMTPILLLIACP
jgi:hypothetical protein